jgi:hypothetical protein
MALGPPPETLGTTEELTSATATATPELMA